MAVIQGLRNNQATNIGATEDGELIVRAIVEEEIEHASGTGDAFAWNSTNTDIDAGDTRLIVRNTSDRILVLDRLFVHPANVVSRYTVNIGQSTTALNGTAVTAVNMNEDFATRTWDYDAADDDTNIADGTMVLPVTCSTTETLVVPMYGLILGKNHFIQINQETESTSGQVTLFGHFAAEVG
jgi:hypothetical protein